MMLHPPMRVGSEPDNTVAQSAEQFFPKRREDIRRLRRCCPIFDEICSDLELMAGLLQDQGSGDAAATESLEGLREEINRALMRDASSA